MLIPRSFALLGHSVQVEFDARLQQDHDNCGEAHYRTNMIKLLPAEGSYPDRPQSKVEHDFCHELVHFLLYYAECSDIAGLYKNELVVDRIAGLLHQVLSTMDYSLPSPVWRQADEC